MAGLIFFVARSGMINVREAVEGEFAVAFEAFSHGAAVDFSVGFIAGVCAHGIDQAAASGDLLKRGVKESAEHAMLKRLVKISDLPKFFLDVAFFDFLREGAQRLSRSVAGPQRLENRFGGKHAALHRQVNALEALRIKEAAGITNDEATIHVSARHGVPAAVGQRLRTIANKLAAIEKLSEKRMSLPSLKRGVRIESWVGVFESDDETDGNSIVRKAVNPSAAVHVRGNRPAQRVRDVAGLNAVWLHVPEFLDADAVTLWIDVVEFFGRNQFFGERAARAFRKHSDFGPQLVAGREVVFGLSVLVHAFVFGDDAGNSIASINQFRAAKFFEDVDARGFDQPAQPFCDSAE